MEKTKRNIPQTPSQFYRKKRPEYFSDSEKIYEVKLPREHFAYELSQISTNQKQDAFETLGRRLAEKFISPSLIPQVGPTGGGDGKTDSETYPVSEVISERWFVPENGWNKNENWAFAISAKQDWKSKIRSDVDKIVKTNRGYTKIFFITNQQIASKKKKETQDELRKEFDIEVIILDGEWIIEKIYANDLISLAVDSLNLSDVYKDEKIKIGENDASRLKRLEEIEEKINNTSRYFEYDYQLVEDALQSAILTRMLEKPKDEVIGKFDRALRFAHKLKNKQQLTRIHYQRAWTYIHWYDEYASFISEFNQFKEYAKQDPNINSIELYFNLINILRGISHNDKIKDEIKDINFKTEEDAYRAVLEDCISNENKPTTSLIANTYKSFLNIFYLLSSEKDVSEELKILNKHLQESRRYLEYPFESFKKLIEVFGEILPDNEDYDILIDSVADISEERASELASGQTFLKRGFQKLEKKYYKDSLIYFGKSVRKLAKDESQDYLYFALRGLNQAYENLGLFWAANNCIIAASSITVKEWYNEGKPNKRFYSCVQEALKKELFIGRIPYLLSWHEIFKVISPQFDEEPLEEGEVPIVELVDGCLSVRLLNSPYDTWKDFSSLPDIFEKETLWLSQDTSLYLLGYTELIEKSQLEKLSGVKTIDDYYNLVANQPFKEQIVYGTSLLDKDVVEFKSIILGVEFFIKFKRNKDLAIFAELLLAFFESFLATSFEEVYPSAEKIIINLEENNGIDWYKTIDNNDSGLYTVELNISGNSKKLNEKIHELLLDITSKILGRNFIFKEAKEYLEKLFKNDELHERRSLIIEHRKFFTSIFGEKPKIFIEDWASNESIKRFDLKRESNPIQIKEEIKEKVKAGSSDKKAQNIKHNQTKVSSIIDNHLWDNAQWKGFGFFISREIPLGVFLAFENGNFGRQIFENWIKRFGRLDQQDEINLSIIKGIDNSNPFWYKVHISKSFEDGILKEGQFMISSSRFHQMNPTNSTNLTNLLNGFNYYKQYYLFPALFKSGGSIEPYTDLGILKRKLTVRNAWEIGEHDFDSVVIKKGDNPFIPSDKPDAPVINLLKSKRDF